MESSNNIHLDENWKLSKKGSKNYSKSKREQSSSSSNCNASNVDVPPSYLKRSSSMPDTVKASRSRPPSSQSSRSFTRKCANLAKEQRAKFYIVRRCVTMLMCWRDYP